MEAGGSQGSVGLSLMLGSNSKGGYVTATIVFIFLGKNSSNNDCPHDLH
jgi:hypothetical protein